MRKTKILKAQAKTRERWDFTFLSNPNFLRFTFIILLISLLFWGWQTLSNTKIFPIKKVHVTGMYHHISKAEIEKQILPIIQHKSFWNVNLTDMQQQLLNLPWIKEVTITRVWPSEIKINIQEQQPIAIWNNDSLINETGVVFKVAKTTFPQGLPQINAPSGAQQQILGLFYSISNELKKINLTVNKLNISQRMSVDFYTNNNIHIILGQSDWDERLARLLQAYPQLIQQNNQSIQSIDLRYPNGLAVTYKGEHHG